MKRPRKKSLVSQAVQEDDKKGKHLWYQSKFIPKKLLNKCGFMEGLQLTNTAFLIPWPHEGQSLLLGNKRSPLSIEKVSLFLKYSLLNMIFFVLLMGPSLDVMYHTAVFFAFTHATHKTNPPIKMGNSPTPLDQSLVPVWTCYYNGALSP